MMCTYAPGSQTAQDPGEARSHAPPNVVFRAVSGSTRPEVRGISQLNNMARSSLVCDMYLASRPAPTRVGAGVWLASVVRRK